MVPRHLSLMASSLLNATKVDLARTSGDAARDLAIKRAVTILNKSRMARWEKGPVKIVNPSPSFSVALGFPTIAPEDISKLVSFAGRFQEKKDEKALSELFQKHGLAPPTGEKLDIIKQNLKKTWKSVLKDLKRTHTLEYPDSNQRIKLEWIPERSVFTIQVEDKGLDSQGPTAVKISADTTITPDMDGKNFLITYSPAPDPIQAKDATELRREYENLDIFGEWLDQKGKLWIIEQVEKKIGRPGETADGMNADANSNLNKLIQRNKQKIAEIKSDIVFLWINPDTGNHVKQKKFRKLKEPFEYTGESYAHENAIAEIKHLEQKIMELEKQLPKKKSSPIHNLDDLQSVNTEGTVLRIRVQRQRDDGTFENWRGRLVRSYFDTPAIDARSTYDDVRDMNPEIPMDIRRNVSSNWDVPKKLLLKKESNLIDGYQILSGKEMSWLVTHNPDSRKVKSVHSPFWRDLILKRRENDHIIKLILSKSDPPFEPLGIMPVEDYFQFRVKVIYSHEPEAEFETLIIKNSSGNIMTEVKATPTDDPLVFITEPILVSSDCKPFTDQ